MAQTNALLRVMSNLAKATIPITCQFHALAAYDSDMGYTFIDKKGVEKRAQVFVNPYHMAFEDLDDGFREMIAFGVGVHELLHQKFTDFDYFERKFSRCPENLKEIFKDMDNIFEDSRIEFYGNQVFGGWALKCLKYAIWQTWEHSPELTGGSPLDEIISALIQYGDMGKLKGEFSTDEAKDAFIYVVENFFEPAIHCPVGADSTDYAYQAVEYLASKFAIPYSAKSQRHQRSGSGGAARAQSQGNGDAQKKAGQRAKTLNSLKAASGSSAEGEDAKGTPGSGSGNNGKQKPDKNSKDGKQQPGQEDNSEDNSDSKNSAGKEGEDGDDDENTNGSAGNEENDNGDEKDNENGKNGEEDSSEGDEGDEPSDEEFEQALDTLQQQLDRAAEQIEAEVDKKSEKVETLGITNDPEADAANIIHVQTTDDEVTKYDAFNEKYECSEYGYDIASRLRTIFHAKNEGWERSSRGRLNLERYLDPNFNSPFVFDKKLAKANDVAIAVLVDCSGSMSSRGRMEAVKKFAASCSEAFSELGVPFAVYGHDSCGSSIDFRVFKDFDEDQWYNIVNMRADGWNVDGASIRIAADFLKRRDEEHKVLIVMSDGQSHNVLSAESAIREAMAFSTVCGVALATEEFEAIRRMYGENFIICEEMNELSDKLTEKLTELAVGW